MRVTILVLVLALLSISATGQVVIPRPETVHQSNLWLQGFSVIRIDERWSVPLEVQFRRAETGLTWQQLVMRAGIVRDLNANVSVGGGYGFVDTWPYGKQPVATKFPEHRTFQQLIVKVPLRSIPVEHRLRLEQRWLRKIDSTTGRLLDDNVYTNRFRYRAGISLPLHQRDPSSKSLRAGDTFLFLNDEVFVNFGRNVQRNTFDQNRFATGIGYQLPKGSIQIGYLHQYIQKADGVRFESNHTITVGLTYNISLR